MRVVSRVSSAARFGSKGALTAAHRLVALAAGAWAGRSSWSRRATQGFTIATYRAETRHRVRLAREPGRQAARR